MYCKPLPITETESKPLQFSLRQMLIFTVWISVGLALLSQIGTVWGFWLWMIFSVGLSTYALRYGRMDVAVLGIGLSVCVAGFGVVSLVSCGDGRAGWCRNNLRQIGIALHNYHDTYGSFPPAYVADATGRPMHSWRVLILPFLEEEALYDRYDFSEPWDGPNNRLLATAMPKIYGCPSDGSAWPTGCTSYVGIIGASAMWRGEYPVSCGQVTDASGSTLLVVESHGCGIPWMAPVDLDSRMLPAAINPKAGQGICSCHESGGTSRGKFANVLFVDGTVRQLNRDLPPKSINAFVTIAGGERVTAP